MRASSPFEEDVVVDVVVAETVAPVVSGAVDVVVVAASFVLVGLVLGIGVGDFDGVVVVAVDGCDEGWLEGMLDGT